jgi:PadR family transcriptional regulator AphA
MAAVSRTKGHELLLGEWACLGILYPAPAHGFAIAARLKSTGDIGRVWSLTRPLTYRSLDLLTERGFIHAIGEERGIAGGTRTILAATRPGRAHLRKWLRTPVVHLRDLRSELLLKLVIAANCGIDVSAMLVQQRAHIAELAAGIDAQAGAADPADAVAIWRSESAHAALRFLDRIRSS